MNIIGALYFYGYSWIQLNWFPISFIRNIMIGYYILIYLYIIMTYKKFIGYIKNK